MARQSFGRTVRYRRTKLGLSQTRLAELVGRSPGTIRSWEAERSIPRDPAVLTTLAAILGVDEALLFERAGVERPAGPALETTPTLEQALASISPDGTAEVETSPTVEEVAASFEEEWREQAAGDDGEEPPPPPRRLHAVPRPAPPRPIPEPTTTATLTPVLVREASYIEDANQRQFYQVRTLASIVGLAVLAIGMMWAVGNGLEALGRWWDDLFSLLRL